MTRRGRTAAARADLAGIRQRLRETRAALAGLREDLKQARARRKHALANVSEQCRAQRFAVRDAAVARRAEAREQAKEGGRSARDAARQACALRKTEIRQTIADRVERARAELDAELHYRAELQRIERANRDRKRSAPRTSAAERRGESDDEVRANIPPDLVPLFERVKRQIRASPRMSRTEALLHYAEEHPGEVLALLEDKTEALIRELEAKERAAAGALPRGRRRAPAASADESVPF